MTSPCALQNKLSAFPHKVLVLQRLQILYCRDCGISGLRRSEGKCVHGNAKHPGCRRVHYVGE